MGTKLAWDEKKRALNLKTHGLDFANVDWVLDCSWRLDIEIMRQTARGQERWVQSFSYVLNVLAVLTVVHAAVAARLASSAFERQTRMNGKPTMSGLNKKTVNEMTRAQVMAAVRAIDPAKDFVWDGKNEDERPLSREEMRAGIEAAKKRGRPVGSRKAAPKVQTAIRIDPDVLAVLRATGEGWQTRVNRILRERFAL